MKIIMGCQFMFLSADTLIIYNNHVQQPLCHILHKRVLCIVQIPLELWNQQLKSSQLSVAEISELISEISLLKHEF